MATMTLSECAAHDYKTGQREKLTGWGRVSKDREQRKVSRRLRRMARKQQETTQTEVA
jgi:hypothetical protein